MTLKNPYRHSNYMGEYADDAAVLTFIQAQKWDTAKDGTGNPEAGMWYFNTADNTPYLWTGTVWDHVSIFPKTNLRDEINLLLGHGLLAKEFVYTSGLITQTQYKDTDGGTLRYQIDYNYSSGILQNFVITRASDSATQTYTMTYTGVDLTKIVVS